MSPKSPPELPASLSGTEAQGFASGEPVAQFQIGDYRNFVYLILDRAEKKAAVVDPQEDLEPLLQVLDAQGFSLERVLLTHTHFDHVAGVEELVERFPGIPIHVHRLDQGRLREKGEAVWQACSVTEDQAKIPVGMLSVRALHTPGHSAGEICYFLETPIDGGLRRYLFSGDTLFIRDCGRTDLETGSNPEMFRSLQRIKTLPADTVILPGHHYVKECASILEREMETSPPLRCRTVQELEALP